MAKLTDQEIKRRLQEGQNYKRLYFELKVKYDLLKKENKQLKVEIVQLKAEQEKMKLQLEELIKITFSRAKKNKKTKQDKDNNDHDQSHGSGSRSPDSYRRPIPSEEEITDRPFFPLTCCPDCRTPLSRRKIIERYLEDIIAPAELVRMGKQVIKQSIATGYCHHCRKQVSAIPLTKNMVTVGENVRMLVVYGNTILRLSFEQISHWLKNLFNFTLSDGEINNILTKQARQLLPVMNEIDRNIRGQPAAHYDESSWLVQEEEQGNYVWVKTGSQAPDTIFRFGQSRGKGVAEKLKGETNDQEVQVGVSDAYVAYQNLFQEHALCWAHPFRKLRDLANTKELFGRRLRRCRGAYLAFQELYHQVADLHRQPFDLAEREKALVEFSKTLQEMTSSPRQSLRGIPTHAIYLHK